MLQKEGEEKSNKKTGHGAKVKQAVWKYEWKYRLQRENHRKNGNKVKETTMICKGINKYLNKLLQKQNLLSVRCLLQGISTQEQHIYFDCNHCKIDWLPGQDSLLKFPWLCWQARTWLPQSWLNCQTIQWPHLILLKFLHLLLAFCLFLVSWFLSVTITSTFVAWIAGKQHESLATAREDIIIIIKA